MLFGFKQQFSTTKCALKLPFNWYLSINRIPVISTFSGTNLLLKTVLISNGLRYLSFK